MRLPKLHTERLFLDPITNDDVAALHRLWTEAEVRQYLWDDEVISLKRAADAVIQSIEAASEEGLGMWALYRKSDPHALIGFVALRHPVQSQEVEILYGVTVAWWRQGFATEASRAVLNYAFVVLRLPRVVACADSTNTRSFAVMRRLRMSPLSDARGVPGRNYFGIDADCFLRY